MLQVALYGRVSTKDKGQDHENQFIELRRFAAKCGYIIVKEYVDKVSGSGKVARAEFEQMLEDARIRQFDLLLFWSLDRFSREGVQTTFEYLKKLSDWGVGWKSYTEQYLDTTGAFKEAIIAILAAIAKQERIRISERVKAGMARAKEHGTKSGVHIGGHNKIFRRDLARDMYAEGKSIREIAKELQIASATIHRAVKGVSRPLPFAGVLEGLETGKITDPESVSDMLVSLMPVHSMTS